MKTKLTALFLAVFIAGALGARAAEEDSAAMPLALYQKLKAHFDELYGARVALLPGVPAPSRQDAEKALRADAAANKETLVKALGSNSALHRELAARALEYCGDKKMAVEALAKSVAADADESVRRAAGAALAKLPDAVAVDALIKGLSDNADGVRGICAIALGNIKDNRASGPLLTLLQQDVKPIVRLQAATALSKIKDPASLAGLKQALEGEKDERVRMGIAGAMRNLMGEQAGDQMPTPEQAANELASLAKEMKEVEAKLRDDRHDQAVQVQGGGIEQKLMALIEKLNKCSSSGSGSQSEKKKGSQPQSQNESGNQASNGKGSNPLADSKLGNAVPPGAANAAEVSAKQDAWAKLPPAQRDELLQAFRSDVPVRWQKRLQAYFYSLNSEEAKNMDK